MKKIVEEIGDPIVRFSACQYYTIATGGHRQIIACKNPKFVKEGHCWATGIDCATCEDGKKLVEVAAWGGSHPTEERFLGG
jgi:hypothetical protein